MPRSRRTFLGGAVAASISVLSGCSSDSDPGRASRSSPTQTTRGSSTADGPLTLRVADRTAAPGTAGTLEIVARNVGAIQPGGTMEPPTTSARPRFVLDLDAVQFAPEPNTVRMSSPPYWVWSPPEKRVSVEVPFHVPKTTSPGRYAFSVTGWPTSKTGTGGRTVQFEVAVRATRPTTR